MPVPQCRPGPPEDGPRPALGALVAIIVGPPWIEPDAIQAGAKLRAVAEIGAETYSDRRRQRKADKLTHRVRHR